VQIVADEGTYDLGQVYTFIPPPPAPVINVVYPAISPTNGGAVITVNGANFKGSDGKAAKVYVDGILVKNVTISSDGKSIRFVAPAHKLGDYSFYIKTKNGATTYGITYVPWE
jgi:hypothetical protein